MKIMSGQFITVIVHEATGTDLDKIQCAGGTLDDDKTVGNCIFPVRNEATGRFVFSVSVKIPLGDPTLVADVLRQLGIIDRKV